MKFDGHLQFLIIYKFCKRDFSLQPPGDPREQYQGVAQKNTHSVGPFVYMTFLGMEIRNWKKVNILFRKKKNTKRDIAIRKIKKIGYEMLLD